MDAVRWIWLGTLALGACVAAPVVQRPYPAPRPDDLLAALRGRHAALRTMNMETLTTSWLGGDRLRATVLMLVDRDGRLRFSAEVRLQGTVADLAVEGDEFALLEHGKRVLRTGRACPANVASLVRIPLLPREIAAVLLGDAPLPAGVRAVAVTWDGKRRADVLELESRAGGAASNHLWVSFRKVAPVVQIVALEGQAPGAVARWRVEYDDLAVTAGHALPSTVRFAEPGRSFDEGVEIKVRGDRRVNVPLPGDAFALTAPPGFTVESLPCPTGAPESGHRVPTHRDD